MAETTDSGRESTNQRHEGTDMTAPEVDAWFAREVLPMEAVLIQFLRNNWRDKSEVSDLLQDVYVRIYEAALKQIPDSTRQFVFQIARNLLIDRARHARVVSFETLADVEALGLVADTPSPEQSAIARDELLRLRAGLERLPARSREALALRQIEGLSRSEIAQRMNISENTVKWHLSEGLRLLADIMYGESAEVGGRT
jgi:RNA polymerase sigma-70 factor (ECF subfamily)